MDNLKTIIAAMSGGVDSSVAAAIYKEKGYRVIGVTLQMKDKDDEKEEIKSCCGPDEKTRARMVCEQLNTIMSLPEKTLQKRFFNTPGTNTALAALQIHA